MSEIETGKRYSHLYVGRGEPAKDSKKARYRIGVLAEAEFPSATIRNGRKLVDVRGRLTDLIQREIGVQFRTSRGGRSYDSWVLFFDRIDLLELLDVLTVIISPRYRNGILEKQRLYFCCEVRRIFQEENLAFTIDDQGGVHPLVDAVFSQLTSAVITGLSGSRYGATLHRIEEVDGYLLQDPPNYVAAIRSVFGACENLFKLMYGGRRLDARSANEKLSGAQQRLYNGHATMTSASSKLLNGFKEWIDAAHFYRHEEGQMAPSQPQDELALLLISEGLSYVRWLAAIDQKSPD